MSRPVQIPLGSIFQLLTVIEHCPGGTPEHPHKTWRCRCICGNVLLVEGCKLLKNERTSCGLCREGRRFQGRKSAQIHTTHGMTYSGAFSSWRLMRRRCYESGNIGYKDYGGKGIRVCSRWLESFENFYADMGNRPTGMTLGRKNGSLDYTPDNCRWETRKQQSNNRPSANRKITAFGETKNMSEWLADTRCEVSQTSLRKRLAYGVSPEKAITYPMYCGGRSRQSFMLELLS